jgi:spore germination protein PC
MSQSPFNWFDEMYKAMCWQSEKLLQLEKELDAIKEQLRSLNSVPKTHVERMEYNFEQLKVENLNGSLLIGLSPGAAEGAEGVNGAGAGKIEDLWIQNQHTEDVTVGGQAHSSLSEQIKDDLFRYIRDDIAPSLEGRAKELHVALKEEDAKSIIEDMIRQTEERVQVYLQQEKWGAANNEEARRRQIIERVRLDVHQAVDSYIEHFRKDD